MRSPVMDTVHVGAVPVQAPAQPVKIELAFGVAVSVTVCAGVVFATCTLQVGSAPVVQLTPPPVTVPPPVPATFVVSLYLAGWNIATTVLSLVMETVDVGVVPLPAAHQT